MHYFLAGEKAAGKAVAPTFKEKPKVAQDASGKNLAIECTCMAIPKPTITWYKGTEVIKEGGQYKMRITELKDNSYGIFLDIIVSTANSSKTSPS
jgi:hypothetical protein